MERVNAPEIRLSRHSSQKGSQKHAAPGACPLEAHDRRPFRSVKIVRNDGGAKAHQKPHTGTHQQAGQQQHPEAAPGHRGDPQCAHHQASQQNQSLFWNLCYQPAGRQSDRHGGQRRSRYQHLYQACRNGRVGLPHLIQDRTDRILQSLAQRLQHNGNLDFCLPLHQSACLRMLRTSSFVISCRGLKFSTGSRRTSSASISKSASVIP